MLNDFAVFICTHGRPNKQLTLSALLDAGYTGQWYLVLDDTDPTIQEYINNYGADNILVFDKNHYIAQCEDLGIRRPFFNCVLYAKLAVEDIAVDLGLRTFMITDDDIYNFRFRYLDDLQSVKSMYIKGDCACIDDVLQAYSDFVVESNLTGAAFGGASLFFGGKNAFLSKYINKWRIPFSIFVRNTAIPIHWVSCYAEDVVTGLRLAKVGYVGFTLPFIQFETLPVGGASEPGGMSSTYNKLTKFDRAMIDFVQEPACIRLRTYHGAIVPTYLKEQSFPKIVPQYYRKDKCL